MADSKRCKEQVYNSISWGRIQCTNKAKYDGYCGTHSPEKRAERAKKRGPTKFELDVEKWKKEAEHLAAAEKDSARLDWCLGLDVKRQRPNGLPIEHDCKRRYWWHPVAPEHELESARDAIDAAMSEEKEKS